MRFRFPKLTIVSTVFCAALATLFFYQDSKPVLTIAFLDVGQGDAIFIESPTGTQVLIDGGPDTSVLKKLARVVPFFDRSLDVVFETHPDKDHIAGLSEVFARFSVGMFGEPGTRSDSSYDKALMGAVAAEGLASIHPTRGDRFDLGGGAQLEVLFPDRLLPKAETNLSSLVMMLSYGATKIVLTGDSPIAVEQYLLSLGSSLDADVLKVGHHGSRTSSSERFIAAVSPAYSIISAGKNNRYGHPHQEVLDILKKASSTIVSTAERGTIVMKSDGENVWLDGQ